MLNNTYINNMANLQGGVYYQSSLLTKFSLIFPLKIANNIF